MRRFGLNECLLRSAKQLAPLWAVLFTLCLLAFSGPVSSQGSTDGATAAETSPLLEQLGPLAAAGDIRAQVQLGRALLRGDGINQDVAAGIGLLEAAAGSGSAEAWFQLGNAYSDGRNLAVDGPRAFDAFQKAIALGSAGAYVGLGRLLERGIGVPADPEAAIAAYEAAVALGIGARAQIALAQGHMRGSFGELSDPSVGEELYRQLAVSNDLVAQVQLGQALLAGDEIEQDIDAGIGLLEAAAEAGSADAWRTLGDAYSRGLYLEVDGKRALDAYEVAVALGSLGASLEIGRILQGVAGLPADPQGAIDAYQVAIEAGDLDLRTRGEIALAQGHLNGSFGPLSDPDEAVRLLGQLAGAGNLGAQVQLGLALVQGDRVAQDSARGIALLQEAATAGSPDAWSRLGDIFSNGQFLAIDGPRALDAYRQAVSLGSDRAHLQIGRILQGGVGVPFDPEGAIAAYEMAIATGDPILAQRAETRLALGHLRGRFGALSDPAEGLRISQRLAQAGDLGSQVRLGQAYLEGDDIEQDIARGIDLLEVAAEKGSPDAWIRLGDAYSDGRFLEVDAARALEAYQEAIALGNPWANLRAGKIMEGGFGLPEDPQGALFAYESAVAAGNPDLRARAEIALAQGHMNGRFGDLSDQFEGERIYERLIAAGELPAIVQLSRALLAGDGVDQDVARAISLLEAAAAKGSADAWYRLGDAYSQGLYLEIDGARAVAAYEEAIKLGSPWANLQLARLLEGRLGVPADPERAISAYEAAIATGQQGLALSAEIGLAQGHLGGVFGSLSDSSEGLRIYDRLAESGDSAAQLQLGRALVRGVGIGRDLRAGVDLLLTAAEQSDRAQREMIFGLIRASARERQAVRQQMLSHFEALSMPPPDYIQFLAAISTSRINYARAWDVFTGLSVDPQTHILTAAAASDRKLYASLLQGTMVTTGDLNGPIDGLFGPRTLRAFLRFCPKVAERRLCQRGPFFGETRSALVEFVPDLLAKAAAANP